MGRRVAGAPARPRGDPRPARRRRARAARGRPTARLAERAAGFRAGRREPIPVRFGATAAAKALYALRPDACPPWDEPIRAHHGWDGSAASYRAALERASAELAEAAASAGVAVAELPALIGRPGSSPPRLVDEHDWLRVTRGHQPPGARGARALVAVQRVTSRAAARLAACARSP